MYKTVSAEEYFKDNEFGHFSWGWGQEFHIECDDGRNFIFSSEDYEGTNIATQTTMTHEQWLKSRNIDFSRDKGHMQILGGMRHYSGRGNHPLKVQYLVEDLSQRPMPKIN